MIFISDECLKESPRPPGYAASVTPLSGRKLSELVRRAATNEECDSGEMIHASGMAQPPAAHANVVRGLGSCYESDGGSGPHESDEGWQIVLTRSFPRSRSRPFSRCLSGK